MRIAPVVVSVFLTLFLHIGASAQQDAAVDSAIRQIQKIKNDSLRLDALFSYNKTLWTTKPGQTIRVIRIGLEDARRSKRPYFVAKAYTALGYAHLQNNNFPEALEHFFKALSLWKQLGDHTREVENLLYIANIHMKNESLNEAKAYALQAVSICQTQKVTSLEAKAYNELGIVYEKAGKSDSAIVLYKKGIAAATREQDIYFETFLLGNIGNSYRSLNQYDLALQAFKQVAALGDTMNDKYISTVAFYNIADVYFEKGDITQSEANVRQALNAATEIQETETIVGSYSLLKKIAMARGDYKAALEYFERQVATRDTVFNQEKSAQLAELQTRYDTEVKDRKINEQNLALSLSRRTVAFMAVGIALVAAIGIVVGLQQRRTQKLNRQIAAQNAELEQLHGVKDRIFSTISHDMRTPVNSLLAFMQLLEQEGMTQEKLAAYSAELKTGMSDTASLLENLLSWAKSQMQGFNPAMEKLSVTNIIDDAANILRPVAERKQVTFYNNATRGIMLADRNMVGVVLRNLIHNAVKYSPANSSVTIDAHQEDDGMIRINITDTGRGMPQELANTINNAATHAPVASTTGTAAEVGTGLGLLLCTTFVKQMNGSLTVRSEAGAGTTCTVALPAA